ncbi:MAG: ubiquinol-cytochrome c reductase iron-sulfur subunit [Nitrospiraceae bacterium]|nr:ubiquinol-cytochrome c reductase iron-sulfur subunit [Nitrospiraceae bacterium]
MERRDFLKKSVKIFFIILGGSLISFLFYFLPTKFSRGRVKFFDLLNEDEIPKEGVKPIIVNYTSNNIEQSIQIFISITKKGMVIFSPVCSHLGCHVNWYESKKEFICPCHGGRYDSEGKVLGGPPPAPLSKLPFKIINKRLHVGIRV